MIRDLETTVTEESVQVGNVLAEQPGSEQPGMSPKQYKEHMKNVLSLMNLELEYTRTEAEILKYKLQKFQVMDALSKYLPVPEDTKSPAVVE